MSVTVPVVQFIQILTNSAPRPHKTRDFMTDKKLSEKEIERRKQASLKAASAPKPHEAFQQFGGKGGKSGGKMAKNRIQRHQGR